MQEIAAAGSDEAVADWLYRNWYIDPESLPLAEQAAFPFDHLGTPLGALLARIAPWQSDWVVLSAAPDGSIFAGRGAVTRWEAAGSYASTMRFGLPPVPGEQVNLPPLLSWVDRATGQWAAQTPEPPQGPLVRIYFNVGWSEVGSVIEAILPTLIEEALCFSMKCPGAPAGFARADTLLLYLEGSAWAGVERQLLETLDAADATLRSGRPALAKRLSEGIAFAEDPGGGQSFGRSRCALLAPALMRGSGTPQELLAAMNDALVGAGIDPERPWENPS